jgi:hypothetical protein
VHCLNIQLWYKSQEAVIYESKFQSMHIHTYKCTYTGIINIHIHTGAANLTWSPDLSVCVIRLWTDNGTATLGPNNIKKRVNLHIPLIQYIYDDNDSNDTDKSIYTDIYMNKNNLYRINGRN